MTHESNPPADTPAAGSDSGPGYELRDTNVRAVVTFLVGLTLLIIVSQVLLWGLLRGMSTSRTQPSAELTTRAMIPQLLDDLHKQEDAVLAGKNGMPIDEAIRRLAEKGIPPTASGLTEADVNSHAGIPASKDEASKTKAQAKDAPK
jgi:hypothetical protein